MSKADKRTNETLLNEAADSKHESGSLDNLDNVGLIEDASSNSASEDELRQAKIKERITALAEDTKDSAVSCAMLDFLIVRPYIGPMNIVLYIFAAGLLGFTMGNVLTGFLGGFLMGTLFLSYPFAISGKYNTPELYKSIPLSPAGIVAGRFIFSLGFATICAAGAVILAGLGASFTNSLNPIGLNTDSFGLLLVLIALFLAIVSIQLPLYFRYGFVRARYVGLIPLLTAFWLIVGLSWLGSGDGIASASLEVTGWVASNVWTIPAAWIAFVLIAFAAYQFSLAAYRKAIN